MSAQPGLSGIQENKRIKASEVAGQAAQINLDAVREIKSSVEMVIRDMAELSAYIEKAREFIEHAKLHILLNCKTLHLI